MPLEKKQKISLFLLIILGTLVLSLTMVRSGLVYDFGMGFWGPNGHDGVWHLALSNQVLKSLPPSHPTLSGFKLTNYHYFFDLILALVSWLTTLPLVNLYFQVFPVLMAFGLGLLSFGVGYWWQKNFWTGFWLAFFNYFGGSFGFLVTLFKEGRLGGESLFWAMQSASVLVNPPFALSLIILLAGLFLLLKTEEWTGPKIILTGLLFGVLVNVKVYAGVVALAGLGFLALIKLSKKDEYLKIWLVALGVSLLIFLPLNRGASSLLVYKPFWFIHSMIESTDRFYWPTLANARYFLLSEGWGPRLVAIELLGLAIFLVGNLGTRGWGLVELGLRFKEKKQNRIDFFLGGGLAASLVLPLLFVQKGTAWNTIQFFYYFLFLTNFYSASFLARIIKLKKRFKVWLVVLICIFTVPSGLGTLKNYLGWPPPSALPGEELAALNYLEGQKKGVVLTFPYDRFQKEAYLSTPLPLRVYESTAYVSAFSGQITFLEDEVNLDISGYNWEPRREQAAKFFESTDPILARGFLLNNQISYLYLTKDQKFQVKEEDLGLEKIYENSLAKIYRVSGIM